MTAGAPGLTSRPGHSAGHRPDLYAVARKMHEEGRIPRAHPGPHPTITGGCGGRAAPSRSP
ncbi:hypothetical protein QJS66_13760 [Kocuria rhizophila]|nr:hypothetical protein QJS66_13760 [Kocuria rhizophila]